MPFSRESLTEEFYVRTSAQLLAQPEPQYLHAQIFMNALNVELGVPDALGVAGREVHGQGAAYSPADVDRLNLAGMLPDLFAIKADFNGEPGHTINFNRPSFVDTTYTEAARQVGTNQSISTTPTAEAGGEQFPLTIKRYAGPYDSSNSRVAPYALDAFDATMGVHKLSQVVGARLKRDFHKTLDKFYVTLGDLGASTVYPQGITGNNDITAKGSAGLSYEQISRVSKKMDEANLPTLADGRRVLIVTPTGKKQLKDDPQYKAYAQYQDQFNPLFPGWFGTLPEFHLFMSNTLTTSSNSSSVLVHYGQAIAPGAFAGGRGKVCEVRASTDDNYQETAKVIWLAYLAIGMCDSRFIYGVRYGEDNA